MTNYLQTPETRQQLAARSVKLLTDGAAFGKLAEALAAFEDATGRAVLISESRTHADNPAAREAFLSFAKRRVAELDQVKAKPAAEVAPLKAPEPELPVEPNGIELENAAQLEAEPIDTGSAETVTAPQDVRQASLQDIRAMKDAGQLRACRRIWARARNRAAGGFLGRGRTDRPAGRAGCARNRYNVPGRTPGAPAQTETPPAASTAPTKDIPEGERRIVGHVESLPEWLRPEDDLRLVELLTAGSKIKAAAEFLQVAEAELMTR